MKKKNFTSIIGFAIVLFLSFQGARGSDCTQQYPRVLNELQQGVLSKQECDEIMDEYKECVQKFKHCYLDYEIDLAIAQRPTRAQLAQVIEEAKKRGLSSQDAKEIKRQALEACKTHNNFSFEFIENYYGIHTVIHQTLNQDSLMKRYPQILNEQLQHGLLTAQECAQVMSAYKFCIQHYCLCDFNTEIDTVVNQRPIVLQLERLLTEEPACKLSPPDKVFVKQESLFICKINNQFDFVQGVHGWYTKPLIQQIINQETLIKQCSQTLREKLQHGELSEQECNDVMNEYKNNIQNHYLCNFDNILNTVINQRPLKLQLEQELTVAQEERGLLPKDAEKIKQQILCDSKVFRIFNLNLNELKPTLDALITQTLEARQLGILKM